MINVAIYVTNTLCVARCNAAIDVQKSIFILSDLFLRMRSDLFAQTCKLGTLYMLYEVGTC